MKSENDRDDIATVRGVTKKFATFTALNDVTLSIKRGECFGLLGPNGAGKSTLIRLLYGASFRDAGEISVFGFDPQKNARQLKKRLGVVTQDDALDEAMTVEENMLLYARFLGVQPDVATPRIAGLLDFMNLAHKKDAAIRMLSGGMRRRLVFVRALLNDPDLLILDEPTTGLDPAVRQLLWTKIREMKKQGKTILLTTHYMDEAEVLCDRLVIIDQGVLKVEGAPKELIKTHCTGYVAVIESKSGSESVSGEGSEGKPQRIEAETLHGLAAKIEIAGVVPDIIRPSNLEDVFLHITGKELGRDA